MATSQPFSGLTALITGASGGIGAEAAVLFAAQGAHTIVHYNTREQGALDVVGRIKAAGGSAEVIGGDLGTSAGVNDFCALIAGREIDILINNAGSLVQRTHILDFEDDLWERVMMLNLTSVFRISKAALPYMISKQRGYIVNVGSIAGRNGGGLGASAYATAKGGVATLTKSFTKEFAAQGIRVNAVSPGTIETNFHKTFSTEIMLNTVRGATPAGRLGTSEETAAVIVFLCSEGASYIHGQTIEINGGIL